MGCNVTKPSMNSPTRGLEKLKMDNGYVNGGYNKMGSRRSTDQKPTTDNKYLIRTIRADIRTSNGDSGGGAKSRSGGGGGNGEVMKMIRKEKESYGSGRIDQEGKLVTRGGEKKSSTGGGGGGGGSGGMLLKAGESDELVDGWPKWLTDNVPKNALAGLVPKSAEAYSMIDKVGQGTYSNVYKARDRETGKVVALKKVRFDTSEPESVKFMAREIMILRKLDHPNIVKLEGLATSRMQYSLYLVFDYMQTDLSRIINRPDESLTEPQVKCYMQQLLSGLQHCHDRGILHRDIKGSNLLIDRDGMLKIADFGLANYYNPDKKRQLTSRVVTLWYRAPELLLGSTNYGPGIDLWSAGCLMAEMFAGRPILPGRNEVEQLHKIFKLCGTPSEDYWKRTKVPPNFRPPHPYKPKMQELFRAFPRSSTGLLSILLALDPAYRGCTGSALQDEFFHTTPLACDLSGLPVIHVEDDKEALAIERRKQRKARMKQRSQTLKEHRRKDLATEIPLGDSAPLTEEVEKTVEVVIESQEPASSSSASTIRSASQNEENPPRLLSPSASSQKYRHLSEAHPNATKNIKNIPPLPTVNTRTTRHNDDSEMYKLSQVQRSISTRRFPKLDQRELDKLRELVD